MSDSAKNILRGMGLEAIKAIPGVGPVFKTLVEELWPGYGDPTGWLEIQGYVAAMIKKEIQEYDASTLKDFLQGLMQSLQEYNNATPGADPGHKGAKLDPLIGDFNLVWARFFKPGAPWTQPLFIPFATLHLTLLREMSLGYSAANGGKLTLDTSQWQAWRLNTMYQAYAKAAQDTRNYFGPSYANDKIFFTETTGADTGVGPSAGGWKYFICTAVDRTQDPELTNSWIHGNGQLHRDTLGSDDACRDAATLWVAKRRQIFQDGIDTMLAPAASWPGMLGGPVDDSKWQSTSFTALKLDREGILTYKSQSFKEDATDVYDLGSVLKWSVTDPFNAPSMLGSLVWGHTSLGLTDTSADFTLENGDTLKATSKRADVLAVGGSTKLTDHLYFTPDKNILAYLGDEPTSKSTK